MSKRRHHSTGIVRKRFTREEIAFFRELEATGLYHGYGKDFYEAFSARYPNRTAGAVLQLGRRSGRMEVYRRRREWSAAELQYVKELCQSGTCQTLGELVTIFRRSFPSRSVEKIQKVAAGYGFSPIWERPSVKAVAPAAVVAPCRNSYEYFQRLEAQRLEERKKALRERLHQAELQRGSSFSVF
ncbi:MAG: hypothetical protein J6V65_02945 [Fibrobacterales bacterium]|nr:hypothetical protein [Fibrobacterales bacterium]